MSDNKKVIHELPSDELEKIVSGSQETVSTDKLTEAAKFIYDLRIRHGDVKISAQIIYHTYKQWKGWQNRKQSKSYFFKDFATYFTSHRTKDGTHYLLDPKPFDLTEATYWQIRADLRREKARKKAQK